MSSEPNSELDKVTPLSQARLNRKSSNHIEIAEERLREILSDVVDQSITAKLSRLETSINRMVSHFEAVRNGEAEDAALRVTTDLDAVDIALSGINLPKEQYYSYSCSHLAQTLGLRNHDVLKLIKELGLRSDPKYHICISTGQTSKVNKWSEATLQKLQEYLMSNQSEREKPTS
jgi:hypothetical protein